MSEILQLTPVFEGMIWGGERLSTISHCNTPCKRTGECWTISAHPDGGRIIASGAYTGRALSQPQGEHPGLFGNTGEDRFPLLTKTIDAKDNLSIQARLNDEYAAIHEDGSLGRTEYWYALDCDEDTQIVIGRRTRNHEGMKQMIEEKRWDGSIRMVLIKKRDFSQINPSCLYVIKGGALIFKIQQSSDIIHRVYDCGRLSNSKLRPLHVRRSINITGAPFVESKNRSETVERDGAAQTRFISCNYYTVDKYEIDGIFVSDFGGVPFVSMSMIGGEGTVSGQPAKMGDHLTLPYHYDVCKWKGRFTTICASPSEDNMEQREYPLAVPAELSMLSLPKSLL